MEELLECSMNGMIPSLPVSSYYDLLQQLGITQISEEKWVELVMKKDSFTSLETLLTNLNLSQITCYGFRMILMEWMQLCEYQPHEQILHIVITRLFNFLKNTDGFVNVLFCVLFDIIYRYMIL